MSESGLDVLDLSDISSSATALDATGVRTLGADLQSPDCELKHFALGKSISPLFIFERLRSNRSITSLDLTSARVPYLAPDGEDEYLFAPLNLTHYEILVSHLEKRVEQGNGALHHLYVPARVLSEPLIDRLEALGTVVIPADLPIEPEAQLLEISPFEGEDNSASNEPLVTYDQPSITMPATRHVPSKKEKKSQQPNVPKQYSNSDHSASIVNSHIVHDQDALLRDFDNRDLPPFLQIDGGTLDAEGWKLVKRLVRWSDVRTIDLIDVPENMEKMLQQLSSLAQKTSSKTTIHAIGSKGRIEVWKPQSGRSATRFEIKKLRIFLRKGEVLSGFQRLREWGSDKLDFAKGDLVLSEKEIDTLAKLLAHAKSVKELKLGRISSIEPLMKRLPLPNLITLDLSALSIWPAGQDLPTSISFDEIAEITRSVDRKLQLSINIAGMTESDVSSLRTSWEQPGTKGKLTTVKKLLPGALPHEKAGRSAVHPREFGEFLNRGEVDAALKLVAKNEGALILHDVPITAIGRNALIELLNKGNGILTRVDLRRCTFTKILDVVKAIPVTVSILQCDVWSISTEDKWKELCASFTNSLHVLQLCDVHENVQGFTHLLVGKARDAVYADGFTWKSDTRTRSKVQTAPTTDRNQAIRFTKKFLGSLRDEEKGTLRIFSFKKEPKAIKILMERDFELSLTGVSLDEKDGLRLGRLLSNTSLNLLDISECDYLNNSVSCILESLLASKKQLLQLKLNASSLSPGDWEKLADLVRNGKVQVLTLTSLVTEGDLKNAEALVEIKKNSGSQTFVDTGY